MIKKTRYQFLFLILLSSWSISCTFQPAITITPTSTKSSSTSLTSPAFSKKSNLPFKPQTTTETSPASVNLPSNSKLTVILGRPTATSITASVLSPTDQQVSLAYGTQPGQYSNQTEAVALQAYVPKNIEVSSLRPDNEYYYSIISNGVSQDEHSFHTQRSPGSSFTFTIDADPHDRDPRFNGELYQTTLTNALNDHPDFHINLGDTFMTEKVRPKSMAEAASTFTDLRPYFGILAADAPLFLVNGNHEGELGWLQQGKDHQLPIWSTQLRQQYYPNPIPNDFYSGSTNPDATLSSVRDSYYAWTWGDALFITLDPFWYTSTKPNADDRNSNWNWTLGKAQYDWLKTTLESSHSKFKFVFIHHLVGGAQDARGGIEFASYFEWGGKNADGSYGFDQHRAGWGVPIHQLLANNHVSAVFHGHDHVFVKQDLDGIVYQEVPQPSITTYNNTQLAQDYGYVHGDVVSSSGHLRVTVTPEKTSVAYVRAYLPQDEKSGQQNRRVDFQYLILPSQ